MDPSPSGGVTDACAAQWLARAAKQTRWADLPEYVRSQAADLILDTVAVIAGGMAHPEYARFAEAALSGGDRGRCTVIGNRESVPSVLAAQIHGGATTVLQFQDGHRMARGHPASHIVPAALALAEQVGATSEAFLTAFVAGYEASVRVGLGLGGLRAEIHDAGTWSTVGPAVAGALLLGADVEQLRHAIEGAATVAILPWARTAPEGATMHHLYIGLAASMGVTVATAATSGFQALPRTVEEFFIVRAGAAPDASCLTQGISADGHWSTYEIMNAYLKLHPTCAHLHGVNDAVDALIREEGVKGSEVASADVALYAHAMAYDAHRPTTELAARFSAAYTTAIALLRGDLSAHAISQDTMHDPDVRALASRITVRHDPGLDPLYPDGRPAVVTVTLHDGTRHQRRVVHPRGDCTNPSSLGERRAKVHRLLATLFGPTQAAYVVDSFDALVAGAPVENFMASLRSDRRRRG